MMRLGLILVVVWVLGVGVNVFRAFKSNAMKPNEWSNSIWSPPYFGRPAELLIEIEPSPYVFANTFTYPTTSARSASVSWSLYGGEKECRQHGIKNCCPPEARRG